MYYTIYKITNKINGKYYIGKHQTKDLNDGYMGSGKLLRAAIAKYGIDNFFKEILFIFDNESDMNAKEKELVVISEESYNLCPGGHGGFGYINENNITDRSKAYETQKRTLFETYGITNLSQLPHNREAQSKRVKHLLSIGKIHRPDWTGKKHTEESKEKIGKKNKGKIPWNKGRPRTEEEKRKISETLKKKRQGGTAATAPLL